MSFSQKPVSLLKRSDFLKTASGRRFHSKNFSVQGQHRPAFCAKDNPIQGLRFGLTVTRKVGNAPVRNRIKRRLRAAILSFKNDPAFSIMCDVSLDLVIVARHECLSCDFKMMISDLHRAVQALSKHKIS